MPDPFEALRTAPTPIQADSAFVARLRARVVRALYPSQGVPMIATSEETSDRVREGDISYLSLWVPDVERAAGFYSAVLGWSYAGDDGGESRQVQGLSLPHGLASLGEAERYLSGLGLEPGYSLQPTAYVAFAISDVEAGVARVRAAGGKAHNPEDRPYGRMADCVDDQGMPFSLHEVPAATAPLRSAATGAREGDAAYLTFEVPDAARARAFFGAVLGWQFSPGRAEDGWNVLDSVPMCGLHGGQPHPRIVPMYRVNDIQSAVENVRSASGTASPPTQEPYGLTATCTDDQGIPFYLGQLP